MLDEPLFLWMVLLHASFLPAVLAELWWRRPPFGGWVSWASVVVVIGALVLRWWTLTTMGRSWNVRVVYGKDYPIVSKGPYAYIRHPNYLVVILELAFIPLIHHLYWCALVFSLLNGLILVKRIKNEEAKLAENPVWVEAMAGKPRFFPRIRLLRGKGRG